MSKVVQHQMKMRVEMMTPEWAQELLDKNHPNNRTPKKSRIEQYARDMRAGMWELTPEPICIDVDGWLTNGQNRLSAVVRADIEVPMTVIFGCNKRAISAQDQGLTRNVVDVSRMMGSPFHRGNNEPGLIRAMHAGLRQHAPMSNFELIEFGKQHKQAIDFAFECLPVAVRGITHAPVRAVIARAFYRRNLRNRTRAFCEVLVSGLPFSPVEDSGAIRLRNWLMDTFLGGRKQRKTGARRHVTYAKTERALLAFHDGEEVRSLIERSEELFPLPGGEAWVEGDPVPILSES